MMIYGLEVRTGHMGSPKGCPFKEKEQEEAVKQPCSKLGLKDLCLYDYISTQVREN